MTEKATEPAAATKRDTDTQPKLIEDQIVEREHRVTIGGVPLDYKSVVGTMVQKDHDEDKPKASIFFMAYFKQGVENPAERPLIISFNGGPGSSSVWLHLGMLGPRRVVSGDVDNPIPPPSRLIDNEHSLLDVADMVFIDPVSTGYSRARARRGSEAVPRSGAGHRVGGRVYPHLCQPLQPLALAQVSDRRELWHHPCRWPGRSPAGSAWALSEWTGPHLRGARFPDVDFRR